MNWYGRLARLNAAAAKALDDEGVRKRLLELEYPVPLIARRRRSPRS
jgi:hypothetical protein